MTPISKSSLKTSSKGPDVMVKQDTPKQKGRGKRTKKKRKSRKKPCWDNYKMVGMKNKNGKRVPNCVYKK